MEQRVTALYFSPTHGTRAYVRAVAGLVPDVSPAGFLQYAAGDDLILVAYDGYGAERSSEAWEEAVAAAAAAAAATASSHASEERSAP